ncbi:MAG TPA: ABC transporter permease [Bryobacteraceae bacterium]|nr:ABC transporter permease [Bryobacteraceae bacterium]
MRTLRRFLTRLLSWAAQRQHEERLQAEIDEHLSLQAADNLRSGLPPSEARRQAMLKFGAVEAIKEEYRDERRILIIDILLRDVRYAFRMLAKNPGFTMVAVLTLALGIGADTAIFSVVESVLFRPLPFSTPDRIVRVESTKDGALVNPNGGGRYGGPSALDMQDFARNSHSFENMAVYDTWRKNVSFSDRQVAPEQMWVGLVPRAYFEILDMKPMMGRLFTEDESGVVKNYIAAISDRMWRDRYGSDPAILGRKITVNDEPYTIVAVMPDVIPEWMESKAIHIWTPVGFANISEDGVTEAARGARGFYSLARIKPGVSMSQAQADLATIAARLAAEHTADRGIGVALETLSETRAHNLRPMLFLLVGAVSLILLIACVNLANLLLARNSARQQELAMRAALGAGKGRLVVQLLTETLLLSVIGGGIGLLLARIGVTSLTRIHPENLPQLASIGVDWRVLTFTLVLSLITSLFFGLGPALTSVRSNPGEALKLGSRSGTAGSRAQRMRSILVVMEMAMSLMLLVGASLLIQSILRLERQQLGIRQDHLLTGAFYLPGIRYSAPAAITRFSDQFADRVRALPGVTEASVTTIYPPNYNWTQMLEIPGRPVTRIQDIPSAKFGLTDSHFLRTLGIPLMRGRDFAASDNAGSPPVALINHELARRYFPTENPLGQRVHIGPPEFLHVPPGTDITDSADVTIIGVIGDFRNSGLASPPEPQIIVLYSQHPVVNYGFKDIVIRTASNPRLLAPEVARQLHALDPDMPLAQVRTIEEVVEQQTGSQRYTALLLGLFAAAGLILAAVGIYGVVSFLVAQRKRELAVRMAVGASARNVLWLVLKEGLQMAAVGACVGLIGVWAAQDLMNRLLFGVSPVDPVTFAGSAVFLIAVVIVACWLPAWRASRVDPCMALRAD